MKMRRREFLATGLALNVASAAIALADQTDTSPARGRGAAPGTAGGSGASAGRGAIPKRMAKTTKMFKSPGMYPNALAVMTDAPSGLWIGQQKANPSNARQYGVPEDPTGLDEAAWLVDWNGKLLKTVTTHSRNTSGI